MLCLARRDTRERDHTNYTTNLVIFFVMTTRNACFSLHPVEATSPTHGGLRKTADDDADFDDDDVFRRLGIATTEEFHQQSSKFDRPEWRNVTAKISKDRDGKSTRTAVEKKIVPPGTATLSAGTTSTGAGASSSSPKKVGREKKPSSSSSGASSTTVTGTESSDDLGVHRRDADRDARRKRNNARNDERVLRQAAERPSHRQDRRSETANEFVLSEPGAVGSTAPSRGVDVVPRSYFQTQQEPDARGGQAQMVVVPQPVSSSSTGQTRGFVSGEQAPPAASTTTSSASSSSDSGSRGQHQHQRQDDTAARPDRGQGPGSTLLEKHRRLLANHEAVMEPARGTTRVGRGGGGEEESVLARLGLSSNAEYEAQTERDLVNARRGLEEVLGRFGGSTSQ